MRRISSSLVFLIFIHLFLSSGRGQGLFTKTGMSLEIFKGEVHVLNVSGNQYGMRIGLWPTYWLNVGITGTIAENLGGVERMDFERLHAFTGLHLRIFNYINPYVIGTIGINKEPKENYGFSEPVGNSSIRKTSTTIKVGLALEINNFRFAIEDGGGSMGTGHLETNYSLSFALVPLPQSRKLIDFTVYSGIHQFIAFAGPYEGEKNYPGFDFSLEFWKKGRIREYNAGIFFTDYIFSTGVINLGTGWPLNGTQKVFDFIDVTPGFQILIWAEGDPDIVLPAASLGIGLDYKIWMFVPFIKTRTIATFSRSKRFVLGSTYTIGMGLNF